MSREGALMIMAAVALVLIALMAWGWWRRTRRDAGIRAPVAAVEGTAAAVFSGLYVATTAHDRPLERLAIRSLAFRSRVEITATDRGIGLDLAGSPTVFLRASILRGAGRATWTVDRVVETDGLVLIAWEADDGTLCDSYLRLQQGDPDELTSHAEALRVAPTTTGNDR